MRNWAMGTGPRTSICTIKNDNGETRILLTSGIVEALDK